jgi:hypothetical protein
VALPRGFKAKANRISLELRADLGLQPHDPLDPLALCSHFDIEVIPLSSYGDDVYHFTHTRRDAFSAVTVPCGLNRAIVHNDKHHPDRQRSNLMHELAHGFLGHPPRSAFDCNGERNYETGIESEASFLSGSLLITNEGGWYIVKNGLMAGARRIYGVSQPMLDFRLRMSGALKRAKYRQLVPAQ